MKHMKDHYKNLVFLFYFALAFSLVYGGFAYAQDHSLDNFETTNVNKITLREQSIEINEYVSGFDWPTSFGFIGDDLFVLEKNSGKIFLVRDGEIISEPVLEIDVSKGKEEGLLGILTRDTTIYLHYTTRDSNDDTTSNWFFRYHWNGEKFTEPKLLKKIYGGTEAHNSGPMVLHSDGKVYGILGDLNNRKGILQNYFDGKLDYTSSIFALEEDNMYHAIGIRNSFGLAVDPLNGNMWITENGPDKMDEINFVSTGFNSGWAKIMGPATNDQINELPNMEGFEYSDPEFSWEKPVSPTSISFVTSDKFEQFHNSVLVGDFNSGTLYEFKLNNDRTGFSFQSDELSDLVLNEDDFTNEIILGTGFLGITSIQQGPDGLLYVLSIGDGIVYQIKPLDNTKIEDLGRCGQELKSGVNLARCDLSGKDLQGVDLSSSDLSFVNFQESNLRDVNMENAIITGSDFRETSIINSDFSNADLSMSTFKGSKLNNIDFKDSNLRSTSFTESRIIDSDFSFSDLDHGNFEGSVIIDSRFIDVNLNRGLLTNTKIDNASFRDSYIDHASFSDSELVDVDLSDSIIWVTDFSNSKLQGAKLFQSDIYDTKFLKTNLKDADFSNSKIGNSFFDESTLSGTNFLGVYPFETSFKDIDVSDTTKTDSCLEHDIGSRIINKILREIRNGDLSFLSFIEPSLLELCTI